MWAFKDDEGAIWSVMIYDVGSKSKEQIKKDLFWMIAGKDKQGLRKLNSYMRKGAKIVPVRMTELVKKKK
jgi:hypothetical protein